MKVSVETLFWSNMAIATFSFIIFYQYDWPIEAIGAAGISWVLISSIEMLRAIRRARK